MDIHDVLRTAQTGTSLRDQIRQAMTGLDLRRLAPGDSREAAVLIPVFERDHRPYFLLTRRTEDVQTHKGQISFPGGMRHDEEELVNTALRETQEEIGVGPSQIEILGRFHDYIASTGYLVSTFAGSITCPFSTCPQTSEVAEIIEVPFTAFLDPSKMRVEQWRRFGQIVNVYFYSYEGREIWGLTARIIHDLLKTLATA